jgi:hypothetical protein
MFGKNCSQLQVFQKGISCVVCCYWALGTYKKVKRVYRTEEAQHHEIYLASFCMNADEIIFRRISKIYVAFCWNVITGRTAKVEWPHATRVSHFAHHYLTATHSFRLYVIKPFISVSPSAIFFLPVFLTVASEQYTAHHIAKIWARRYCVQYCAIHCSRRKTVLCLILRHTLFTSQNGIVFNTAPYTVHVARR